LVLLSSSEQGLQHALYLQVNDNTFCSSAKSSSTLGVVLMNGRGQNKEIDTQIGKANTVLV